MKQLVFVGGADFLIKDASGQDRFFIDGKAFQRGEKLSFQDMSGREVVSVRQRNLPGGPSFVMTRLTGPDVMLSKQHFTLFGCRFSIDIPGMDHLEAKGSFSEYDYQFWRRGTAVAEVTKVGAEGSDTYWVQIEDEADDVLILACTVVLDLVCNDGGGEPQEGSLLRQLLPWR